MSTEEILAERYRLVERLHVGERHETLLVIEPGQTDQMVVLKRLLAAPDPGVEGGVTDTYATAFAEAARLGTRLDHRAICAVRHVGAADGVPHLVRDFVAGRDLRDLKRRQVLRGRRVPEPVVLYLGWEICAALDAALQVEEQPGSGRWTMHGHLVPQDILLSHRGEVKLINFASSHWPVLAPNARTPASSASYRAPEQQAGQPGDTRSDVFSVGVILYELLAGVHPHAAGHDKPAEAPSHARASLPEALDAVLLRAIAPDPDRRYVNPGELASKLRDLGTRGALATGSAADLATLMRQVFPRAHQVEQQRVRRSSAAISGAFRAVADSDAPGEPAVATPSRGTPSQLELETVIRAEMEQPPAPPRRRWTRAATVALVLTAVALVGGIALHSASQRRPVAGGPRPNTIASAAADSPASTGVLEVLSDVPVQIVLDNEAATRQAPFRQQLAIGPHTLTLRFPQTGKHLVRRVTVRPGKTIRVHLVTTAADRP